MVINRLISQIQRMKVMLLMSNIINDSKIKNSIVLKAISFLVSLITAITVGILPTLKFIFKNIISSLLLSYLILIFFHINFVQSLSYIILTLALISVILNFKLFFESFINQYDSTYGGYKFFPTIKNYLMEKEKYKVSPIISKNNNMYRVIEYGDYGFNPTNERKLNGFLVISEDGKILNNKNQINEIINLYHNRVQPQDV